MPVRAGDFSIDHLGFANLTSDEQRQILDYPLMVYICEGTDREKLDWFKIINIAGERLTDQELRNAVYAGEWLHEAKRYFSKTGCPAAQIADKYLAGSAIRQDYLEATLGWIAAKNGCAIEDYMAAHQHDTNCNELWLYFQSVYENLLMRSAVTGVLDRTGNARNAHNVALTGEGVVNGSGRFAVQDNNNSRLILGEERY